MGAEYKEGAKERTRGGGGKITKEARAGRYIADGERAKKRIKCKWGGASHVGADSTIKRGNGPPRLKGAEMTDGGRK